MKIAVVGATGMVGEVMLQVLAERNFLSAADGINFCCFRKISR
jgi:aspartate-semialdehyde dehydrogenase